MNLEDLKKPFVPEKISWRVGPTSGDKKSGIALAYIDARDVQDRLDEVCGIDGWQCRYTPMHDKKTVCEIGVKVQHGADATSSEWIWKADGAGDTDMEAEKGALSDAFKRAAVRWGIGRYLYDVPNTWVTIEPAGKSYKIAESEYAKLRRTLGGSAPKVTQPAPEQSRQPEAPKRGPTLAQWVAAAPDEILALKTPEEMSAWLIKNNAAIEMLHDRDKALYNTINSKIAQRNDELRKVAA